MLFPAPYSLFTFTYGLQFTLPISSTLVPVLLTLDQTHLTNFSGDKKLWPIYMSIGNINSIVCDKPSLKLNVKLRKGVILHLAVCKWFWSLGFLSIPSSYREIVVGGCSSQFTRQSLVVRLYGVGLITLFF